MVIKWGVVEGRRWIRRGDEGKSITFQRKMCAEKVTGGIHIMNSSMKGWSSPLTLSFLQIYQGANLGYLTEVFFFFIRTSYNMTTNILISLDWHDSHI